MEFGERSDGEEDLDDNEVMLDAGEFLDIGLASLSLPPPPPPLTGLGGPVLQPSFFVSTIQLSAATARATRPMVLPAELMDEAGER